MEPNQQKLSEVRLAVERTVLGEILGARSRFLACTTEPALGPEVDPVFPI